MLTKTLTIIPCSPVKTQLGANRPDESKGSKKTCISMPKGKIKLSQRCLEAYYIFIFIMALPQRGDKAL